MKKVVLISLAAAGLACGRFETWTNADGKTAELELVKVTEVDGGKVGEFRMRNRRLIKLKASQLSDGDAKRLDDRKESSPAPAANVPSVFDPVLEGNLVRLEGRSLKRYKDAPKPSKYYVFYRTASWCGPCQKFTPSLVEFYKENKTDEFEVVVITSDSNEDDMEAYALNKQMPWPLLKLRKVESFKKKFPDKGTGIPYLVVAKLDGEIVAQDNAYRLLPQLKQILSN